MNNTIPNFILRKSKTAVSLYEAERVGFPLIAYENYMLCDKAEIYLRQEVFRDVLLCPELVSKYEALLKAVGEMVDFSKEYGSLMHTEEIVYSIVEIQTFTVVVDMIVNEFIPLIKDGTIKSTEVISFVNAVFDYSETDTYKSINEWLRSFDSTIRDLSSVTLGVNLDAQFKVTEVGLVSFNKSPFVRVGFLDKLFNEKKPNESFRCITSLGAYETKKLIGSKSIAINKEFYHAINDLFAASIKKLKNDFVYALKAACVSLAAVKDDLDFIVSSSRYIVDLKDKLYCLVFPTLSERTNIRNLYNPNLLNKLLFEEIVPNDVLFDEISMGMILTGPNSGGKTVYVDSIGIAQLMFQLGLPIAAAFAEMRTYKVISTIYVLSDNKAYDGRLAAEVIRLEKCLSKIEKEDTLLLLDETFSGTSAYDGVFLAESLVKFLVKNKCSFIYITHFHELSERISESYKDAVNVMTAQNEEGKRTYKIAEYCGIASESSLAKDIVIENGLGFLFE